MSKPRAVVLLDRTNKTLDDLEAMVGSWHGPEAIPPQFSGSTFDDIVAKLRRCQVALDRIGEGR